MKKKSNILGIITVILAIISILLKKYHIPAASAISLFTFVIILPSFLTFYVIESVKEKKNVVYVILGSFFALTALWGDLFYNVMSWPVGQNLMLLGYLGLFVTILIAVISQISKEKENRTIDINPLLIFLIFISLSFFSLNKTQNNNSIEPIITTFIQQNQKIKQLDELSENLLQNDTSFQADKYEFLMESSNLLEHIENLKIMLVVYNSSNESFEEMTVRDYSNTHLSNELMILQAHALELKKELVDFSIFLLEKENLDIEDEIKLYCNTESVHNKNTGETIPWEYYYFEDKSTIEVLMFLNQIQLDILSLRFFVLNS